MLRKIGNQILCQKCHEKSRYIKNAFVSYPRLEARLYQIENGLPIPPKKGKKGSSGQGSLVATLRIMNIGDSITPSLSDLKSSGGVAARLKIKICVRGGRVWRVE